MLFNNIHCETISKFDVVVVLLLVILENHILLQKRRLPDVAWDLKKKRKETKRYQVISVKWECDV